MRRRFAYSERSLFHVLRVIDSYEDVMWYAVLWLAFVLQPTTHPRARYDPLYSCYTLANGTEVCMPDVEFPYDPEDSY